MLERGAELHIRVSGAGGVPIPGADLGMSTGNPQIDTTYISRSLQTDAQGSYRFTALPRETVRLSVHAKGWVSRSEEIRIDSPIRNYEVILERGNTIGGRVLGTDLSPVAGSSVRVGRIDEESAVGGTQTLADGTFQVDAIPDGEFEISAEGPNGSPLGISIRVLSPPRPATSKDDFASSIWPPGATKSPPPTTSRACSTANASN